MEISSTNKFLLKVLLLFIVVASTLFFLGAAKPHHLIMANDNDTTNVHNSDGEETFTFFEKENGEKVKYEVHFNDGEITSLYRNGNKLPEDKLDDYEDLVHNRLSDLSFSPKVFAFNFDDMKWDKEKFKEDMDKLREDLKEQKFEWHNFDKEALKENMDQLKENLKNMKLHEFHFKYDGSELKKQLEELEKQLEELKVDSLNLEVNMDQLKDNLDEAISQLDKNIVIAPGAFDHQIEIYADNDGKVNHRIKIFKDKDEENDEFVEKLKDELVKDKIISSRDDFESFELTDKKMLVNDEKQSNEYFKKYKKFYEKNSDNELEGKFKIRIQE
jgi:hypothetical protein